MKRAVYPLYAPADESRVKPILDALEAKGVTVRKDDPRKGDALVLFLSEAVKADSPVVDQFFRLQNALMARHAIFAQRYAPAELAELIRKALPEKRPLPLILALLGAAAFLAVGAILLFRQRQTPPPPAPPATEIPATATPAPTEPPRVDGIDVDLEQVAEVVFMGDEFHFYTFDKQNTKGNYVNPRRNEDFAYGGWMDDGVHFYSKEDGHEYPHATLDDISWLALLPNLRFLSLYNVTAALPDLSGLTDLRDVMVGYSDLPDLEGLRGSTIQHLEYHGAGVSDFSPLTDCQNLRSAHLDLVGSPRVDLSGFHPPKLTSLGLGSGFGVEGVDFSFLLQCPNLQELHIDGYPQLTDLSCLANAGKLKKLELHWTDSLRTLAGLEGAPLLEELRIDDLEGLRTLEGLKDHRYLKIVNINNALLLRDISPLEGCSSLGEFRLSGNGPLEYLTDVSVLGRLPRLQNIALFGANHIGSLDFLKELQIKNNVVLEFCIAGPCDYSGIAAIDTFRYVHANTCGNYAAAAPYLEGKTIRQLMIYNGGLVDLSTLPNVTGELDLCDCLNRDLTGIRELKFSGKLWIQDCPYFTSFDGIENLTGFGKADSILTVEGCPRLTDWSGVEGKRFDRLELKGVFTLPDLSKITFTSLALEYLEEDVLPDLTCLNGINENRRYNFRFVGMDQITDLSPLFRLKGYTLEVPPQVGEQAKGLVEDKRFTKCEIVYPDGGWDPSDVQVQLLSLDELETLPPSLLKHVKKLTIIGDRRGSGHGRAEADRQARDPDHGLLQAQRADGPGGAGAVVAAPDQPRRRPGSREPAAAQGDVQPEPDGRFRRLRPPGAQGDQLRTLPRGLPPGGAEPLRPGDAGGVQHEGHLPRRHRRAQAPAPGTGGGDQHPGLLAPGSGGLHLCHDPGLGAGRVACPERDEQQQPARGRLRLPGGHPRLLPAGVPQRVRQAVAGSPGGKAREAAQRRRLRLHQRAVPGLRGSPPGAGGGADLLEPAADRRELPAGAGEPAEGPAVLQHDPGQSLPGGGVRIRAEIGLRNARP